jgi:hypothetical protein
MTKHRSYPSRGRDPGPDPNVVGTPACRRLSTIQNRGGRVIARVREVCLAQAEGDTRAGATQTAPPPCTRQQQDLLRRWLQRTGRSEEEILRHYGLTRLEELPALTANRLLERLIRLDHDARQARRRNGGKAGAR